MVALGQLAGAHETTSRSIFSGNLHDTVPFPSSFSTARRKEEMEIKRETMT